MIVVQFKTGKFALRRSSFPFLYEFLDLRDDNFFWTDVADLTKYCLFDTYEEAKARLHKYQSNKTFKNLTKQDYGTPICK